MNDSHLNSEIQFVKFKIIFNNLVPFFSRNQNQKPIIKESRIEIDKYLFLQVNGIFGIGILVYLNYAIQVTMICWFTVNGYNKSLSQYFSSGIALFTVNIIDNSTNVVYTKDIITL